MASTTMMMYIAMAIVSQWTSTEAAFRVNSAGNGGTCALNDGEGLKCWGRNDYGQLGIGHSDNMEKPLNVTIDLGTDFVPREVGCGSFHCCSVSTTDLLKCWGLNEDGQLGYGDNSTRGDEEGEMGDNLDAVQLPDGFVIAQLVPTLKSTCVMSTEGEIVCFGLNDYGQCGVGHNSNIGDDVNQMGDYLVAVDLGTDFDAVQLTGGGSTSCAVSSVGQLKCWGWNKYGQLGQGDSKNRGDGANEMGDYLAITDLGTGFYVEKHDCGTADCCALSTDGEFKCWGYNVRGASGYEDDERRGDDADEMGDNLLNINVGTGFVVQEFVVSNSHTCAHSTSGGIKCWGKGHWGVLGYGDGSHHGMTNNSMGDFLPFVDIGSGFSENGWHFTSNNDEESLHHCVYEESTDLLMKCWGANWFGQLGYGDYENRGDDADEMGDNLLFVDHGFSASAATTAAPTTAAPTSVPTTIPSVSPTDPICDADAMYPVIWHNLLNEDNEDAVLLHDYSVDFDASTLSLTLGATLEYVGLSADGNFDDSFNLGTTYWIDLQSFTALDGGDGVDSAGTCANRQSSDYEELDFDAFFGFTTNPMDLESATTSDRMAYPPSDWTLTASSCNVVEYERTFSWTELTACADADGNALVSVTETADSVLLEGTFFVELVSPYSMSSDEYYRSFPLIQQDFGIALSRTVNVLSSTNTQLFIASVIGYGRDDAENYEVRVLIQSADYVQLVMDASDSFSAISAPDGLTVSGIEVENSECLVASTFTCGQIFKMTVTAECSDDDNTADLSGNYQFAFTPDCQTLDDGTTDPACEAFLETLDETDGKVVLDVDVSFIDNCDASLFEVTFGAEMAFYSDDAFAVEVDGESDPFVIGQDTIYGKVAVDIPVDDESGESFDFIDVEIEAVYVCTAEDIALLGLDSETGLGGCLSSYIDADGPYKVIGTGFDPKYQGNTTYDVAANNEAAFSFLTFDTPRETINVHVQLLVTMETESGERRRRRMLLQSGDGAESNAFKSYIGTASVQDADTTDAPMETDGAAAFSVGFMPAMFAVIGWLMMD